jgi:acetyl/propionyl-CoA carboxylase alpha subunit
MNTRLQVEHAVTEMTTGIDLVAVQLHLAATKKLPLHQEDIVRSGHALECRLYAEDAHAHFAPSTGTITYLSVPRQPFTRVEYDLHQGQEITPFFDPMIAKCVVWGATRTESIDRMHALLAQFLIQGITTNGDFLKKIITSNEFINGDIHTQLLADTGFMHTLLAAQVDDTQADEGAWKAGLAVILADAGTSRNGHDDNKLARQRQWKEQQWW